MPLGVDISINGRLIDQITVSNVGHPARSGHPADNDLRRYEVVHTAGPEVAHVEHRRSSGARELARKAIVALEGTPERP